MGKRIQNFFLEAFGFVGFGKSNDCDNVDSYGCRMTLKGFEQSLTGFKLSENKVVASRVDDVESVWPRP